MDFHFRDWPRVTLTGLAQVAFCDRPLGGALVLAGIAVVAPMAAVGAFVGAFVGTAAAYSFHTFSRAEKQAGIPGPNPAIVGILWGAVLPDGTRSLGILVLGLIACLAIEQAVRRALAPAALPPLSLPAVLTAFLVAFAFDMFRWSIWQSHPVATPGNLQIFVAIALVVVAMALKSPAATLQASVLAVVAGLVSGWIMGTGAFGPAGLWAFTIAPAAFAAHAIFLAGSTIGAWAGLFAAVLGALTWTLWVAGPFGQAPPLLLPFIVATWATLALCRHLASRFVLDPVLWKAAEAIRRAHSLSRPVVALTGAGASTGSGIPDYVSGAWLDPDVPVGAYSWQRFIESPRCRRLYWEACDRFRGVARTVLPNAGHVALATLERSGWLATTVTQNVDRLHQAAGATRVIELHGRIDKVRCTGCDEESDWPAAPIWRHYDLRCAKCDCLMKPAVVAFGEELPRAAWASAQQAVDDGGVFLVVGSQLAVSPVCDLMDRARAGGAKVIVVNIGPLTPAVLDSDIVLPYKSEEALPALARLLDCTSPSLLDIQNVEGNSPDRRNLIQS